jgi:hypothetical protein
MLINMVIFTVKPLLRPRLPGDRLLGDARVDTDDRTVGEVVQALWERVGTWPIV